jgi:aromatic-L-amino-acid decarboxylase
VVLLGSDAVKQTISSEPHLDPEDWQEFGHVGRQALDDMIAHLQSIRDRKVWQQTPARVSEYFETKLPRDGRNLSSVLADFKSHIAPFATGN